MGDRQRQRRVQVVGSDGRALGGPRLVVHLTQHTNALDQPIGFAVPGWTPRPRPPRTPMYGRLCAVEPLVVERTAADLFAANQEDRDGRMWTYLPVGPFDTFDVYRGWLAQVAAGDDPLFHAIIASDTGEAVGAASYLRIDPPNGAIEVGFLQFSPRMQRTAIATEAMYLMMRRVFAELGYRRYEWKCDRLNAPSMAAARRLGFFPEGVFRQAVVYKGRNRDTAWFSILDSEWPRIAEAFETWLAPENFDGDGRQRTRLSDLTARARASLR